MIILIQSKIIESGLNYDHNNPDLTQKLLNEDVTRFDKNPSIFL